jgi:hypothetical protein
MSNIDKLLENTKPVVFSPHWTQMKELLKFFIEQKRESLEMVTSFDEVLRIRGYISALREICCLEDSIKQLDTNSQSRERESLGPSSIGTVRSKL